MSGHVCLASRGMYVDCRCAVAVSCRSFWPMLIAVRECLPLKPFPAAVYCGGAKPTCTESLLSCFAPEMETLVTDGFTYLDKSNMVLFHSLVCDTPARALVKCIRGHTSYSACERYEVRGEYSAEGRKIIYRDESATRRSKSTFNLQTDPDHHNGKSPLLTLRLDLGSEVPFVSMHLVYLRVVKKIFTKFWLSTALTKTKLSRSARCMISERLVSLKAYMPREFNKRQGHCWNVTCGRPQNEDNVFCTQGLLY